MPTEPQESDLCTLADSSWGDGFSVQVLSLYGHLDQALGKKCVVFTCRQVLVNKGNEQ